MLKKQNIILTIMLLFILFLLGTTHVNATTEIKEVEMDMQGAVPVVGEGPKEIEISSEQYEIVSQKWYEMDENGSTSNDYNTEVMTFEYGKTYYFTMYIQAKTDYIFNENEIVITTKNITWDSDPGKGIITNPDNPYVGCVFISGWYTTGTINANIVLDGKDIVPTVGEAPKKLTISSDEYEIYEQNWYDENYNEITTFKEGEKYFYMLVVKSKVAYGFDGDSKMQVNNISWIDSYSEARLGEYGQYEGCLIFMGLTEPVEKNTEEDTSDEKNQEDENTDLNEINTEKNSNTNEEGIKDITPTTGNNEMSYIETFVISGFIMIALIIILKKNK